MNQHIGIRVPQQTQFMLNLYAAEPQITLRDKSMNIKTKADTGPSRWKWSSCR